MAGGHRSISSTPSRHESNFDIMAKGQARVQNGLPVLYLLSSEGEISELARLAIGPPHVHGRSRHSAFLSMDRRADSTHRRRPTLGARPRASRTGPNLRRDALRLAPLKLVSVGMAFYEDYSQSSLLVGPDWLEAQVLPMSQAADHKRELGCRQLAADMRLTAHGPSTS